MYLLDTNIFLEVLLDRGRAGECEELLGKLEAGELTGLLTSFGLHSVAVVLERLKGLDAYKLFLETITRLNGLLFYSTSPSEEIEVCGLAKETGLDFDDALHYYVAKKFDLDIVSFDKHFDGKGIKRVEPKDIL